MEFSELGWLVGTKILWLIGLSITLSYSGFEKSFCLSRDMLGSANQQYIRQVHMNQSRMDKILQEASDPNTSSERLAQIVENTGDMLVTKVVACHPNINIDTIELLGDHLEELLTNSAFAIASGTYTERIERLFAQQSSSIPQIRITETSEWFEWILDHPEPAVRQAIAQNPYLPERTYASVLTGSDDASKLGLVLNATIPAKVMKILALDDSVKIRKLAISRLELLQADLSELGPTARKQTKQTKRTSQEKSGSGEGDRLHPMIFAIVLLLLLGVIGLIMVAFQPPQTTASRSKRGTTVTTPPVSEDSSKSVYENALSIAAKATLEGQLIQSADDVRKVQGLWTKAIAELNTIQPQSPYYAKAQAKTDEYKTKKGLIGLKKIKDTNKVKDAKK